MVGNKTLVNVDWFGNRFVNRILWISKNDLAEIEMSAIKFSIFISIFCLGTFGLLVSGMEHYFMEIFLGMIAPLIIGIISIYLISDIQKKSPEKVTNILLKTFVGKMIFFGAYFIYIFTFYSFNPTPFIISFTGYFLTLHVSEALFLKTIFTNKP